MTTSEFEKLITNLKDKLFRFAFSILRNSEDSQDAVQEVVLKLWKRKRLLNNTQNIESYFMNAVKNHCFDILRKEKHRADFLNSASVNLFENPNNENADFVEKLKNELEKLPVQQRIAIELKDFQGYKYDEISKILDQSINTIRVNVSRGRKKLYEIFKEELKDA